jgi:transposase-like protein
LPSIGWHIAEKEDLAVAGKRGTFSAEDKVRILRRHFVDKVPISDLCDTQGLHPTLFYRWRKEFFENGASAFERGNDVKVRRPGTGKDKIALRVGKVLDKYKAAKHFVIDIADDSFTYRRNEEGIREESRMDGLYVVRTSVPADVLSSEETVRAYKGLSSAERAFRSLKTLDIEIRPIYHYRSDRVK